MRKEQLLNDDIFVIHDFLSPAECAAFIARTEAVGYGDAPISTADGPVFIKEVRNNDRAMLDDTALATELYGRARPFLPDVFRGLVPCGFNERFRFYRYTAGQMFNWHFDGEFHRHDAAGEESKLTFMVYLNDACEGGETLFQWHEGTVADDLADLRVRPSPGKALVFRHDVLHTGAEVTAGVKYVLRTDVMFRPLPAPWADRRPLFAPAALFGSWPESVSEFSPTRRSVGRQAGRSCTRLHRRSGKRSGGGRSCPCGQS